MDREIEFLTGNNWEEITTVKSIILHLTYRFTDSYLFAPPSQLYDLASYKEP